MLRITRRADASLRCTASVARINITRRLKSDHERASRPEDVQRQNYAPDFWRKPLGGFARADDESASSKDASRPSSNDQGPHFSAQLNQHVSTEHKSGNEDTKVPWNISDNSGVWTTLEERLQGGHAEPKSNEEKEPQQDEPHVSKLKSQDRKTAPSQPKSKKKTKPGKPSGKDKSTTQSSGQLNTRRVSWTPIKQDEPLDVPQLQYNLDRVLFNPGVYQMQDHRSGVFNFDPYLASIMPVDEFDWDALREYVTSSKDTKLRQMATDHKLKYCGSTSSMSSILSHFHFLLSSWRQPSFKALSRSFVPDAEGFTALSRAPAVAFLHHKDGVYAIDADKEFDSANILSKLGHSMEKVLTLPKEEFEKYRKSRSHQFTEEERNAGEAYHYSKIGDFLVRSQLDAHDPRLPGTGMFDLKTRAVISIRMDVLGYEKGVGYEIRRRFGMWESFEREYFDMIRAAFLKYSLQVRMGRMDGIFVAFHNTQRIFGFQYISLAEMDAALHGQEHPTLGDREFRASMGILNDLLNKATRQFPGRTLRLHVETERAPAGQPVSMLFFAEPVDEEEMKRIQERNKPAIEEFERRIRKTTKEDAPEVAEKASSVEPSAPVDDPVWDQMMAQLENVIGADSAGMPRVRKALQRAVKRCGLEASAYVDTERHLDSLSEALTLHLYQVHEDESNVQHDAEENEQSQQEEWTEVTTEEEDTDEIPLQSSESSMASGSNGDAEAMQVQDTAELDREAAAAAVAEDEKLTSLIFKVMERVDAQNPSDRLFDRLFASMVTEIESKEESVKADTQDQADGSDQQKPERQILGLRVTVQHYVAGKQVKRPEGLKPKDNWIVKYRITELDPGPAFEALKHLRKRRKRVFSDTPEEKDISWHKMFGGRLKKLSASGEEFRTKKKLREGRNPVYGSWSKDPIELP